MIFDVEIREGKFGSLLYVPKGVARAPAILTLHGSEEIGRAHV